MANTNFPLILTGRYFSMTARPASVEFQCTSSTPCQEAATHRLLSRATASVDWLCDSHAADWARSHGHIVSPETAPDSAISRA